MPRRGWGLPAEGSGLQARGAVGTRTPASWHGCSPCSGHGLSPSTGSPRRTGLWGLQPSSLQGGLCWTQRRRNVARNLGARGDGASQGETLAPAEEDEEEPWAAWRELVSRGWWRCSRPGAARPSADLRQEEGAAVGGGGRAEPQLSPQPVWTEDSLEQPCLLSSPRQRPWSCSPGKTTHTGTCCGRWAGLARAQAASAEATVSSPSRSATTWLALREAWGCGLTLAAACRG